MTDAMKNSDIFTAIKIISGDIGASEFVPTNQEQKPVLELINNKPDERMSSYNFWYAITAQTLLTGNGYAVIYRKGDIIEKLVFVMPHQIMMEQDTDTGKITYQYTDDKGDLWELEQNEVLHFRPFSNNGLMGISPLMSLRKEIGLQDKGMSTLLNWFDKGVQSGGTLILKNAVLGNDAKRKIREDFEAVNSGANNNGGVIVLDDSQEFKQYELNTDILKMIQNNEYSTKQIAKAFGIPLNRFSVEYVNTSDGDLNANYINSTLRVFDTNFHDEILDKLGIDVHLHYGSLNGSDTISRLDMLMNGKSKGIEAIPVNVIQQYYGIQSTDTRLFGELTKKEGGETSETTNGNEGAGNENGDDTEQDN